MRLQFAVDEFRIAPRLLIVSSSLPGSLSDRRNLTHNVCI
jgi:hypothetical protein